MMNANVRLILMGLVAAGAVAGTTYLYSTTWPDEQHLAQCRSASGKAAIDACSAVIKAGTAETSELADAYYNRGNVYLSDKQYPKAISDYGQAIKLQPSFSYAFDNRGCAYDDLRQRDRALKDYDQAIKLSPDNANAYYNRGLNYADRKRTDLALADYGRAIKLRPDYVFALRTRGQTYFSMNQYAKALQDLDQVVKLNPGAAEDWNATCWTRALWGRELDKALADCNQSLKLSRNYYAALDSRALVYYRLGKYDKAVADDSQALSSYPDLAPSRYVRGLARLRLGLVKDANADIAVAKKSDPKIADTYAGYGVTP